ncbi:MAG: sodium:proton antiporter [Roseibacillus sp.]|nr:sodium:proton antiporter [Roseibacillus sp.]MDP7657139.1 sodium:proton antiporter [Roseibacillus sp.]
MEFLDLAAILLVLAAVFGYLNLKFLKLPTTIGIMLIGLLSSVVLLVLRDALPLVPEAADRFVESIDFNKTLMEGMLSFLLFAGALHVNLGNLLDQKRLVAIMASFGVVLSTFLIGGAAWLLFPLFGFGVPFLWCLVFGALISPTDPVAVLGILKTAGAPKSLEAKITGESLFNDGVGVVVYLALLGMALGGHGDHGMNGAGDVAKLFVVEAGGGMLWGFLIGFAAYFMLRSIDNYQIEVLITLALVTAGYRLASHWHLSGPLAMVVAGLMIGNQGRSFAMSERTREHIDTFWELVDEILNAVLFLLIGLELLVLDLTGKALAVGAILIAIVLASRFVATSIPVILLKGRREFSPGVVRILTWGGLRGGISVALALGIPKTIEHREVILVATYVVVVFSIVVQGLTLKPLVARVVREGDEEEEPTISSA